MKRLSLTSLITGKSQTAINLQTTLRDIIPKRNEFYTYTGNDAFSSNYITRVPNNLTNVYHSSVVGTAFDYLARLIIAQNISITDEVWIDSASEKGLKILHHGLSSKQRSHLTKKYERGQMIAKKFVTLKSKLSDELINHSAYLARLEHVFRSGKLPMDIEKSLFNNEEDEIIRELIGMCEVFESEFMHSNIVNDESDVVFNPTFGLGSRACGGADADVFIDGVLYDFKTTKHTGYKWQDISQLFGYYFLDEIAKKFDDPHASLSGKKIKRLAFYKARFGEFEVINLDSFDQRDLARTRDQIASILNINVTEESPIKKPSYSRMRKRELNTKKDVLRVEKTLYNLKADLSLFSEQYFNQKINERLEGVKEVVALEELKSIPIDTISNLEKRIPFTSLKEQGINTVSDVVGLHQRELMQLDGIGKVSAEAIHRAVGQIATSVQEQVHPRINPDHLSNEDVNLLEVIHQKFELLNKADTLKWELSLYIEEIHPSITLAKERKGYIRSLFQSKQKKEQIAIAFSRLNNSMSKIYEMQDKLSQMLEYQPNQSELIDHFTKNNAAYYTEIEKISPFRHTRTRDNLPTEIVETVNDFPLNTTHLKVDLRHYQAFGAKYGLHFKRTLLGDEMGLGKTIQALAMINHLDQNGQHYSLVVCPLSILANWKREIYQHSNLKAHIFHGHKRDEEFAKWREEKGILLTTYEHTLRMDKESLQGLDILIVDEAHFIKNPGAKRSQSVYELSAIAEYVLYMSGTPLENRLEEMKQLIAILDEDIADQLTQELHVLEPAEFKATVAPVYLRRNRKDVLAELPELEIIPQWSYFGEEERLYYYQAVQEGHLMNMRRAAWLGGSPSKSPKLQKLLEICNEAGENGQKVLVFSFFRDVISVIHDHLQDKTFEAITGDVSPVRRQEIIDEFTDAQAGSILISQITAGGVGLNIQAANIVILCEPQWKPSTEEQAISCAYRMGQARNVVVYRLLTEDSIDVSMLEVLGDKAELFDLYARDSEVASLASLASESEETSIKQKVLRIEQERLERQIS